MIEEGSLQAVVLWMGRPCSERPEIVNSNVVGQVYHIWDEVAGLPERLAPVWLRGEKP